MNERNIQPLSDDYIKFIRFGQHFIDKNGSGILAYISNNSFIDGIIHRQMRKHLLESFDKIYILNLHGNAKKKEVCPDGSPDQNVFDIMQGVSINIFIKTGNKNQNELEQVFHFDLQGKREFKYEFLNESSLKSITWNILKTNEPNFFLVNKNFEGNIDYEFGFKVDDLFVHTISGIQTGRDNLFIDSNKEELLKRIKLLLENKIDEKFKTDFNIKDSSSYNLLDRIIKATFNKDRIIETSYKPFQKYFIYYDEVLLKRSFYSVFRNIIKRDNIGLCLMRSQVNTSEFKTIFLSKDVIDLNFYGFQTYFLPLYVYPVTNEQQTLEQTTDRTPNLNPAIVKQIAEKLGLTFTNEKETTEGTFAPIDILDYIYAVLHSPTYREKYKEFLKIDFPRVPYPKDVETFWQLVKLGGELRQIHLLESPTVSNYITQYPIDGDNVVGKIKYQDGKVYINDTQHFDNVPEVAWNFYIGGYQPAQKWLKDRKNRKLEFDDILHYQKIIVALTETDRLMNEINKINIEGVTNE